MWNIKLKTLHYLYVSFPINWGYMCPDFLNCPTIMSQTTSTVYNFLLELPLGLNRTWANLIRNLSWRMWIPFFVSLTMIDLGHWVCNYSESQKILVFLLAFSWQICQTWRFQKIKVYLCMHLHLYLFIK